MLVRIQSGNPKKGYVMNEKEKKELLKKYPIGKHYTKEQIKKMKIAGKKCGNY